MVATIYGSSQAQLSERLGNVMRCDARFTADIKKPRISEADIALLLMVNLRAGCHGRRLRDSSRNGSPTYGLPVST
ncbi:hypothetical protein B7T08_19795 [Cronobacter sakazakii]|nr:hypothetical protein B7T08_19795 [Cronobacter sakazakii]PUV81710.1 hypothetical protein B7T10_20980 [Cronobacter sakazakii]PUV82863.1 hypothetical protein B7T11_21365 [Cronobacter sakazakii]